jgi:hypothetical protein
MDSEPNWGAVARDATEMIWQKTINALAHNEKPPVGAHMGFGGAYGGDVEGVCTTSFASRPLQPWRLPTLSRRDNT